MELLTVENLTRMFFGIGVFATSLYALKIIIFAMSGADSDVPDGNIDVAGTDSDVAFSFVSLQSILAFFMGFGWTGLAFIKGTELNIFIILAAAIFVGLLFMALSAYLTYVMKSLNNVETFDMNKCVGTVGKAYSTIKPHSEGQVELEINSKLTVTNAMNDTDDEISAFQAIKVVKYENNKLFIEKV